MKKENKEQELTKKMEFIGLNLEEIPETLKLVENLQFKPNVGFDEKKYRQYRFVSPKEIEILLSPTNRLDDIKEKYTKANPLISYLQPIDEENLDRKETFLRMLDEVTIEEIEKIEQEQQQLNKKIPFKVRYPRNYLWQIYYSSASDKYFMIVPTEDKDYSTFFYVLKKQIEKKKAGKVFVPISNADYGKELLNKTEITSLENYLWLFTKDWPSIYEVYDKNEKVSLQIVGQTEVYGKIKSEYKVKLSNKIEATKFFKLVKALFILQSELPSYFKFDTEIDKQGSLEFYYDGELLEYDELSDWVNEQHKKLVEIQKKSAKENVELKEKLKNLKMQIEELEIEYLSKEKQISTFLECKKTFFGKVKYFFKYSGKKSKKKEEIHREEKIDTKEVEEKEEEIEIKYKRQYTLDELLERGKIANEKETEVKNCKMDINALKLKRVNLVKKIENATAFIEEIDSHKKSIFEFWKYSNKDEIQSLEEGQEEPINVKPHSKVFDFEEDFEEFGTTMDKIQREILSKEELDSIYLTTTEQVEIINKLKTNNTEPKELDKWLKQIKTDLKNEKDITEDDVIDIFGGLSEDTRKVAKLANTSHREQPKNKYSILRISRETKTVDYKVALINEMRKVDSTLEKNQLTQNVSVYKWTEEEKLDARKINVFNLNPEKEIEEAIKTTEGTKINLYKLNLEKGINVIAFTNSVYYDNQNKTLPIGMNRDTRIIAKISDTDIKLESKRTIRVGRLEDEKDEASKLIIKTINVLEYTVKEIEEDNEEE
ncbi:MAG: hypothetical protein HFJ55_07030 [Clostridia bacterium]|nr:hypothetical protein [Clostridia bacterium]